MTPTRREFALLEETEDGPAVLEDPISATALVGRGWLSVGRHGWGITPAGANALSRARTRHA
jgi:hypothetical protein